MRGEAPAVLSRHSATPLHGRLWVFGGSVSARPASGAAAMGSAAAKRGRVRCPTPTRTLTLTLTLNPTSTLTLTLALTPQLWPYS